MVWKTATTTARNISGPATGCRKTASRRRVHLGGAGGVVRGLAAHAAGPLRGTWARPAGPAVPRARAWAWRRPGNRRPGPMPSPLARADQRHRSAQFRRERLQIQLAAAAAQVVRHVQDDQRGQAQRQNGRGQHQVARQVGGIEHQQDGFGLGSVGALAGEHVVRHLLVFRARLRGCRRRADRSAGWRGRRAARRCRYAAPR